jgi:ribosomal protein S18 acetylase RimI-like enzyme
MNKTRPSEFIIRPLLTTDRELVNQKIVESWGAEIVIAHEKIYLPAELPGFGAFNKKKILGLLTYQLEFDACEIVTLNSWEGGVGIGSALINTMMKTANLKGCKRLWLVTTNDNTNALRFYQKRGFVISGIRINALETARHLKPEIPILGEDNIPIRDEIELELKL